MSSGLTHRADGTPDALSGTPLATTDREFFCQTCGARCTRGTEGLEYGHRYGCPERPDELPTGDRSAYDRYKQRMESDR